VETADRAELIPQIRKYFSATIIITWIVWLPALLIRNYELVVPIPYDVFIKIGSFVPTLVALFLIYKYDGSEGIRLICRSLINFRIRIEWLFFIFLVLPGVLIASYVILRISGGNLPRMGIDPRFIPIAFLYVLIFLGPLGEEIGWRGFALKRILRNTPPIQAAIFVGTIWSIWHLPLFLINGTTQNALAKFGLLPGFFWIYALYGHAFDFDYAIIREMQRKYFWLDLVSYRQQFIARSPPIDFFEKWSNDRTPYFVHGDRWFCLWIQRNHVF
jgi:membrane protease YdiL (CAAX protease family)